MGKHLVYTRIHKDMKMLSLILNALFLRSATENQASEREEFPE